MLKKDLIQCAESFGAQCAFVTGDLKSGKFLKHKEDLVVPSASLIKIPVMLEIIRQIGESLLSPEKRMVIPEGEKVPYSVLEFLDPGNSYTLMDLLKLMTIYSDNTAANVLIDLAGMDKINLCLDRLGLKKTILQRKMMDFHAREEGRENYTTAKEMADLMIRLYQEEIFDEKSSNLIIDIMKGQGDESMMRVDLPDDIPIARKSGELENLNHETAIVYTEKGDYLYVFFVWDAPSNNAAREVLQRTSKMVYDHFTLGTAAKAGI